MTKPTPYDVRTAAMLRDLGYVTEAEAMAMTGLSAAELRKATLPNKAVDARGRPVKESYPIGSALADQFIFPHWNVAAFLKKRRGAT